MKYCSGISQKNEISFSGSLSYGYMKSCQNSSNKLAEGRMA